MSLDGSTLSLKTERNALHEENQHVKSNGQLLIAKHQMTQFTRMLRVCHANRIEVLSTSERTNVPCSMFSFD